MSSKINITPQKFVVSFRENNTYLIFRGFVAALLLKIRFKGTILNVLRSFYYNILMYYIM